MKKGRLLFVGILLLIIWLVGDLKGFHAANFWLYDQLVGIEASQKLKSPHVLLIDTGQSPEILDAKQWQLLFNQLSGYSPALIAFTFAPSINEKNTQFDEFNVLIGLSQAAYEQKQNTLVALPLPQPISEDGRYRFTQLINQKQDTFSKIAAASVNVSVLNMPDKQVLINFNQGQNTLPIVSLERVISGGLIKALVENKVVVLGAVERLNQAGFSTPIHTGSDVLSLAEFEAYSIETLIRQDHIQQMPRFFILALLLLVGLASLFIYRFLNIAIVGRITLGILLLYVLVAWLILHFMMLWIPLFSLMLLQISVLFMTIYLANKESQDTLYQVLMNTGRWARGRLLPEAFYQSNDHWKQVMNLIDQSLSLQRLILLEAIPHDHRVKEVSSLRCSMDDIIELRRDYERTPYSLAIEQGGAFKLNKPYLKSLEEDEQQYLVSLSYSNTIVGFWAFSIAPEILSEMNEFEGLVRTFAMQIAEILYHRGIRQAEENVSSNFWKEDNAINQRLMGNLDFLERRWGMMEQVLSDLHTATLVYDPFGSVLSANNAMEALAKKYNISVYDLSILQFLTHLTKLTEEKARKVITQVLFEKKDFIFPLSFISDEINVFVLSIKPIAKSKSTRISSSDATPFDVKGLLFEVFDASILGESCGIKSNFMDRLISRFSDDMQILVSSLDLLAHKNTTKSQRQKILERVSTRVNNTGNYMNEVREMIQASMHDLLRTTYPIDTLVVLKARIAAAKPKLEKKRLTIISHIPHILSLGLGQPGSFTILIDELLDMQIEDVETDSQITIEVSSTEASQIIKIFGVGYGIPKEDAHRFLYTDELQTSTALRHLKNRIKEVESWGGELRISSELSEGWLFELELTSIL